MGMVFGFFTDPMGHALCRALQAGPVSTLPEHTMSWTQCQFGLQNLQTLALHATEVYILKEPAVRAVTHLLNVTWSYFKSWPNKSVAMPAIVDRMKFQVDLAAKYICDAFDWASKIVSALQDVA